MKLFYFPGACSMSVHIALNEVGASYDMEKVDLMTKTLESGGSYLDINPKGYVPCLQLDDGQYLTEVGAILQYIADNNPDAKLLPPVGDEQRYRVIEFISYISGELHKNFAPLFNPEISEEERAAALEIIGKRLDLLNDQLGNGGPFLTGEQFTIADAYLTTVLGWAQFVKMDLSPWPNLGAYAGAAMSRPAVQATLKEEGMM
ncbi:MAG: glutathione transferase GstA [Gammaproteobacteria bacterium]|nr:MAG: glutathione transferase GstA [Gammaproteobacteria bacterium]RLA12160.1 MAG: glutathione transferase GstA [Gammaproteobacteria bacterium]RLA14596.1 MAG: glutathione transferase GstA [Gammaproteobacteria bacterium]